MGTYQFDLFCTSTIFISLTFSVLRPLYFDLSTSTSLLRLAYFDFELFTWTSLVRPLYFDLCQIWTSYWSRSTGRSTVLVEVKFGQKSRSKVQVEVKSVGRSTEKFELMRSQNNLTFIIARCVWTLGPFMAVATFAMSTERVSVTVQLVLTTISIKLVRIRVAARTVS